MPGATRTRGGRRSRGRQPWAVFEEGAVAGVGSPRRSPLRLRLRSRSRALGVAAGPAHALIGWPGSNGGTDRSWATQERSGAQQVVFAPKSLAPNGARLCFVPIGCAGSIVRLEDDHPGGTPPGSVVGRR